MLVVVLHCKLDEQKTSAADMLIHPFYQCSQDRTDDLGLRADMVLAQRQAPARQGPCWEHRERGAGYHNNHHRHDEQLRKTWRPLLFTSSLEEEVTGLQASTKSGGHSCFGGDGERERESCVRALGHDHEQPAQLFEEIVRQRHIVMLSRRRSGPADDSFKSP